MKLTVNVQIIIPIFNPAEKFYKLLCSLKEQAFSNFDVLIIDSGTDEKYTAWIWDKQKISVRKIEQREFNHGGTRQLGIGLCPNKDIYVFFTQDAILVDRESLGNIVNAFKNEKVGCAYGRQRPHEGATWFAGVAREINYPDKSYVRSFADRHNFGMKTAFISNSFAAYRYEAMKCVGGFPVNTILSEDMWVAAKMLMNDWQIAYVASAQVYHSHNYTVIQEFKRYFDIGVFHARDSWIRKKFGGAGGSGIDFAKKELAKIQQSCFAKQIFLLSEMVIRDGLKFIGYKLGENEKYLPIVLKKRLSMNKCFWGGG